MLRVHFWCQNAQNDQNADVHRERKVQPWRGLAIRGRVQVVNAGVLRGAEDLNFIEV